MKIRVLAMVLLVCGSLGWAQTQSPYLFTQFPTWTATASAQTSPILTLSGSNQAFSYTVGNVNLVGTALTTVTFAVQGSRDYGATYNSLVIQSCGATGGSSTTATATANGCYWVNLSGVDHVKLVTSGTFTGTSVAFTFRANPNVQNGRVKTPVWTVASK